jgi:phosphate ABC transporter phosphate-binding protein
MTNNQTRRCRCVVGRASRTWYAFAALLVSLALVSGSTGRGQTAETLSQVKKVYIESFGQENGAAKLRDRTIERLRENRRLEVVAAPNEADAVIKGSGGVWVAGYVSNSPRSPSNTRHPIYHGFLSVEMIGKDSEPLWSYLVTPSKFGTGDITKDLADHLVAKLAGALERKNERVPVSPAAPAEATAEVNLAGAGATLPAPLYQKWFESFHQQHPNVHIKYSAVGSGAGLDLLTDSKVDFAASDMPLSNERMSSTNKTFLHVATVLGAVVPVYDLKGIDRNLNFTPQALAGIYLGKIKKWNDPGIRESNRGAALPDSDIVVIHRTDGSGTTFVWTDYLSKVSPEWKVGVGSGSTVKWPVGIGAEGNEAVATMVQQTPNSLGYVELVHALRHQLSFGAVRNAAGQFVSADLASVTAAATDTARTMTSDSRVSITNASGKGAYPISTFTWWLLPQSLGGGNQKAAFLELLQWILSSGQKDCSVLGYAPLPHKIASQELELISKLK